MCPGCRTNLGALQDTDQDVSVLFIFHLFLWLHRTIIRPTLILYKLEMWDEYVESETCHLGYGSNFCINDLPYLDEVKKDCHLN
ncbi:hypothetical protein J31TS6_47800 [Brevibacillus reuszeri]|nr:hypothetical protein J31TS6_47800 [Brevibacillus reuszeri]